MSSDHSLPLLQPARHEELEEEDRSIIRRLKWWQRVLDTEEAKKQVLFSMPMILTNLFYYGVPLASVMFAGHLGELELAGATLANSWATVTGFAFMTGLSGALETLCGQGFGAKLYRILGIHLQASCIVSLFFSTLISIFWFFTESVLILLHQDSQISKTAAVYMKFLIPGIFAYGFLQNILRFLQTQSIVLPLVIFSVVPFVIHIGIAYALVHWTVLGFVGAPLAASISLWLSVLVLAIYVTCSKRCKNSWEGISFESFSYIFANLRLALPSAAMVWTNEELRNNYFLDCNVVGLFSDSSSIITEFGSMTPLLAISITLDSVQGVLSGVARGCGWQHLAVYVNLATFFCIGVPIAVLLGFELKLHVKGLWIGLICGLSSQAATLLVITLRTKWTRLDLSVDMDNEDPRIT
ncbi:hypothetical protein NL676_024112 [Syzygium grande]|nr:hypothetical protein NL676_024112 [Syzygium grande]